MDGLGSPQPGLAWAELAAGLVLGALLVWQQSRKDVPLLPLDLLRIPLFALSICTSMCSYAAQILAYVSLPFLFQTVMHRTAVATGLLVTPWPLLVAVAAPIAGRLSARYPAALLGSIGLAILATGLLLLATMPAAPADWDVVWRMGICGIGFGFYQTPNNLTLMTAGPPARNGAASGMVAVARTIGWSMGAALVALIFELRGSAGALTCLYAGAGFAVTGMVVSISRTGRAAIPARLNAAQNSGTSQKNAPFVNVSVRRWRQHAAQSARGPAAMPDADILDASIEHAAVKDRRRAGRGEVAASLVPMLRNPAGDGVLSDEWAAHHRDSAVQEHRDGRGGLRARLVRDRRVALCGPSVANRPVFAAQFGFMIITRPIVFF